MNKEKTQSKVDFLSLPSEKAFQNILQVFCGLLKENNELQDLRFLLEFAGLENQT